MVRKLEGQGRVVRSVGFSSDGRSVAFGNASSYSGVNQRGPLEQTVRIAGAARRRPQAPPPPEVTDIRQILPPRIYVLEPKPGHVEDDGQLAVQVRVVTDTRPLTSVRVLLNGSPIHESSESAAAERPVELELDLASSAFAVEGENVLTFTAAHDAASAKSEERRFYYAPAARPEPRPSRPNLYVVAVGIADYDAESLRLSYPDDDARAVAAALESQRGRLFDQVHTRLLPEAGSSAGRTEILEAVSWLSREGTQKDVRVLFLAGHGDRDASDEYYFFSQTHRPGSSFEIHNVRWKALLNAPREGADGWASARAVSAVCGDAVVAVLRFGVGSEIQDGPSWSRRDNMSAKTATIALWLPRMESAAALA